MTTQTPSPDVAKLVERLGKLASALRDRDVDRFIMPAALAERTADDLRAILSQVERLTAERGRLRANLQCQTDNMAFVLNRLDLRAWHDRFDEELANARAALTQTGEGE